jgi:hypothetical protein
LLASPARSIAPLKICIPAATGPSQSGQREPQGAKLKIQPAKHAQRTPNYWYGRRSDLSADEYAGFGGSERAEIEARQLLDGHLVCLLSFV